MGRSRAIIAVRRSGWNLGVVLGALGLTACSSVSLGHDGEPVELDLGQITWTAQHDDHHLGELDLVDPGDTVAYEVSLLVPDTTFDSRAEVDVGSLALGSRVFLMDPQGSEFRAVQGVFSVSRRGGGYLQAIFTEAGREDVETGIIELSMSWTSWQVDDRRVLGGGGPDEPGDPVRGLGE